LNVIGSIISNKVVYEEVVIVNYKDASKNFIENEKQFHLGVIPTEQSNPRTKNLSATIQKNTQDGVKMILSADVDISPVAAGAFKTPEFQQMVDDMKRVIDERRTILFSSVGASGRIAIQIDSTWRKFWTSLIEKIPARRQEFLEISNCSNSIITGGDRALVRSVENFEDYMTFGARQVEEAGVGPGDVVIGLSECGLSASINGSVLEALERGCKTYYIYCNPKDILCTYLERTRKVFEKEDIVKICLYVGNMAVAGSTRMEITTIELLAIGAALEVASWRWLNENLTPEEIKAIGSTALELNEYAVLFKDLLSQMSSGKALEGLAQAIELEAATYLKNGLVTYTTHEYLPDIMTDTTERQPTFTLPPFKKYKDPSTLVSWAYVKDPIYPSQVAWQHVFRRPIKGLDWTFEDYTKMGAAQDILSNPPAVGSDEVEQYNIGCEDDPSRYLRHPAVLIAMDINGSANKQVMNWFHQNLKNFDQGVILRMGDISEDTLHDHEIHIPVVLKRTLTDLIPHLMVKLAFNLLSTATMAKIGRIFGNWMIQVLPTNKKLIDRSTRIIANLANISYEEANQEFFKSMLGRSQNEVYRESYVVETLKRLGIDLNKDIK